MAWMTGLLNLGFWRGETEGTAKNKVRENHASDQGKVVNLNAQLER